MSQVRLIRASQKSRRSWVDLGTMTLLLLVGCSRTKDAPTVAVETVKRGDRVVVEPTAADFFDAQVLEVLGAKVKLQRSDNGDILQVGKGDVYRLSGGQPHFNANDFAICEFALHRWQSCRIRRALGNGFSVVDTDGTERELNSMQLLAPTGLSEMNIRRKFEETARRRSFADAVSSAGVPRRVPGWGPAPRRLVIAERNGHWYGAQVTEVDDERVVLRWDGAKDLTDLPKNSVMPQPPACGVPERGDRALRRPSGHGAPWVPVVVVGVDGGEVTIENIERVRLVVDIRELCPLGEPKSVREILPAPATSR
jgi:hypothetical protein